MSRFSTVVWFPITGGDLSISKQSWLVSGDAQVSAKYYINCSIIHAVCGILKRHERKQCTFLWQPTFGASLNNSKARWLQVQNAVAAWLAEHLTANCQLTDFCLLSFWSWDTQKRSRDFSKLPKMIDTEHQMKYGTGGRVYQVHYASSSPILPFSLNSPSPYSNQHFNIRKQSYSVNESHMETGGRLINSTVSNLLTHYPGWDIQPLLMLPVAAKWSETQRQRLQEIVTELVGIPCQ